MYKFLLLILVFSVYAKHGRPWYKNTHHVFYSSQYANADDRSLANSVKLKSYSALAVDADTGKVLVRKNSTVLLPIASISKLMTAMVVLDAHKNLHEYVTIEADDIDLLRHTFSRLKVGYTLQRQDLLLLTLMSSENRAAFALGRTSYVGGIRKFIQLMNQKAKNIGMIHTKFYDPTGLTSYNQSTAEDLVKMVQAAFKYNLIREYTTTKDADVFLKNYVHRYRNTDHLVKSSRFPTIELSKTGFTNDAGHCLVLYSTINHHNVIIVLLGAHGDRARLNDAVIIKKYLQKYVFN